KIGLTTTLKNAWTTSRQVNFFWVANFNLKFGFLKEFLKNFKNYEMLLTGDEKGGRTGSIKKESRKRNE
ncbi:hypothetical protein, partial [Streptococcus pneumoniae]